MRILTYTILIAIGTSLCTLYNGLVRGDYIIGLEYGLAFSLFLTAAFVLIGMVSGRMC